MGRYNHQVVLSIQYLVDEYMLCLMMSQLMADTEHWTEYRSYQAKAQMWGRNIDNVVLKLYGITL